MSSAVSECGGRGQLAGPQLYSRIPGGDWEGYWGTEWKYWHMHRHHFGTGTGTKGTGLCIVTIEPLWFADIGLRVGYRWCVPLHTSRLEMFFWICSGYIPSTFPLCSIKYVLVMLHHIWVPAIFRPSRVYGSALVVKIISLKSENVSEKCVNAFLEEIWWWSWLPRDSGSRGQGRASPGNGHNGRHHCISHTVTHYLLLLFQ